MNKNIDTVTAVRIDLLHLGKIREQRNQMRKVKSPEDIAKAESRSVGITTKSEVEAYWERIDWALPGVEFLSERHPLTKVHFWKEERVKGCCSYRPLCWPLRRGSSTTSSPTSHRLDAAAVSPSWRNGTSAEGVPGHDSNAGRRAGESFVQVWQGGLLMRRPTATQDPQARATAASATAV